MLNLGLGICSSFCTVQELIPTYKKLCENYNVFPFMSKFIYKRDTRFGKAKDLVKQIENITNKKVITDIVEIEPFGPNNMFENIFRKNTHLAKTVNIMRFQQVVFFFQGILTHIFNTLY